MVKSLILIILIFYLLALLQASFLVYFSVFGMVLNLILICVLLINFLADPQKNLGILSALIGGFFLDIFSDRFFGFWVLILFLTALFVKLIFRKYVRIPFITRT